jgi:hypothetical protein
MCNPMTLRLPDLGSQTGSQRRQTPSDTERRPGTIGAVRWPVRRHPATPRHSSIASEKRKVDSSILSLTTTDRHGWQPAAPAFRLFRVRFHPILTRVPGCAAECRRVRGMPVGAVREADLWDFCGAAPKVFGAFRGTGPRRLRRRRCAYIQHAGGSRGGNVKLLLAHPVRRSLGGRGQTCPSKPQGLGQSRFVRL